MGMLAYIMEIKKQFVSTYNFIPTRITDGEPLFDRGVIPDGVYPMTIDGKLDRVRMEDNKIHCCNFEESDGE
jgi:hypothetical protein